MAKQIYIDENGNEQLVSGTINTADMLPIESGSSTNTKDYIDSVKSDVAVLNNRNNIKYYDLAVTTVANSYVSPFSAYKSENLPADLQSKTVLSAQVLSHSATNPTSVQFKDYTVHVYSKSAEAFDVRVVYID